MPGPKRQVPKPPSRRSLDELPDVLTVGETATLLRLSRNMVYESIHRQEIPVVRFGRKFIIPKAGLCELLRVQAAPAPAPPPRPPVLPVMSGDYLVSIVYKGGPKSEGAVS